MITSGLILIVLYLLLLYAFECIKYFNKIDERFGNSLWRWSYDYPVKGKQDISNIDDPEFVALRRRRNTARAEILAGDSWRALTSSVTSLADDCPAYCWPSLGLGNIAGAEILEGDVCRALKSVCDVVPP